MNTKENFSRRKVLTMSVLVIALWLPLTTFAQDFPEAGDFAQGTSTRSDNCDRSLLQDSDNRVREERTGFAETDPAGQQSRDAATFLPAPSHRVQQTYVGFSETDPAGQQSRDALMFLLATNHRVQKVYAGFSETDPAANIQRPGEEIYKRAFLVCQVAMAKAKA